MADGDRAAAPRWLLRASTSATLPPIPTCRPDSRTRPPFGSSCHTSRAIAWSRSSAAGSPLLGTVTQWSETNGGLPERGALIVDKVGFLAELYVKASVVLVGCSYDSRVHSVWEPAAYAKPMLTGPHIRNSAEALALEHCGLLRVCPDARAVARALGEPESDPQRYSRGLEDYLAGQRGIGRRYAERLLTL
jgi:hypothetical protein